jgi:hypothetical protein
MASIQHSCHLTNIEGHNFYILELSLKKVNKTERDFFAKIQRSVLLL